MRGREERMKKEGNEGMMMVRRRRRRRVDTEREMNRWKRDFFAWRKDK